jgi:indole-3-acetate monooxygenase
MDLTACELDEEENNMNSFDTLARVARLSDSDGFTSMLRTVDDIGALLRGSTADSEAEGHLTARAREALRDSGAMHMRVPVELGGPELSLTEQMVIVMRLAEYDSASAWCTMVANNGIGGIAEYLSDEGVAEVFADGPRPIGASIAAAGGPAAPVQGGYRVSGRWRFCSNIHSADWVRCTALVDGDAERPIMIVVPQRDIQIQETWNVTGLRGTGSADFELEDVFVPTERTADMTDRRQLRGSRNYSRDVGSALAVYEHAAFAIGISRRAFAMLTAALRGDAVRSMQEVVQNEFSQLSLERDAAELLAYAAFAAVDASDDPDAAANLGLPAIASYVTELAKRCVLLACKRVGSRSLFVPNPWETMLRDIVAAQAHVLVSDRNYTGHGATMLKGADAPALILA